jgi:hypothetical protein
MDERLSTQDITPTIKAESLGSEEFIYRHCLVTDRDRKNKEIPAVRNFAPTQKDKKDGLSVYAANLTTPEMSLAIVGAQYQHEKTEFKDYSKKEIYKLQVKFVRTLPKIEDVIHDPIFAKKPLKGHPNNLAHSLITFTSFDFSDAPEVILKMRDHAVSNGKVDVNMIEVHKLTLELRREPKQ